MGCAATTGSIYRVCLDTAEKWNWKLKTEKYCSIIIFKCVNSTVRPIFNEKVAEKCSLWDPWIVHENTVHGRKVKKLRIGKKKNNSETRTCIWEAQNTLPKRTHSLRLKTIILTFKWGLLYLNINYINLFNINLIKLNLINM